MQTPMIMENVQETTANMQGRINQLEETIDQLYQSFCPLYGTIDFTQVHPEDFTTPYATHTFTIPDTQLSVKFIATPPLLLIGAPSSYSPGPLHWKRELNIELPANTMFVRVGYGGEAG